MRSTIWGVGLGLALVAAGAATGRGVTAVTTLAQAQTACPPLQMSDIEDYVDVKAPVAVVRRRVNECGLGFTFDKTAEDRLRTLGAQADLIAMLTNLGRAGLEVRSTPAGAAVTIDGQRRGTTPLTISDLAPGAHKVLLSFEGYLDNASEVTIKAGATDHMERTLTRAPSAANQTAVAAPKKGGSKLPWILGGVGLVGGGVAIAAGAGGGGGTVVTPPVVPPPSTTCTINITRTSFTFGFAGGSVDADVTTNVPTCAWSFSNLPSWLTLSNSSGTGNQTVKFTAQANIVDNNSTSERTAAPTVGGQSLSVSQSGLTCTYTLELYVNDNPFVGGGATTAGANDRQLILNTGADCRWTGVSSVTWMDFRSARSPISGTGPRPRGQMDIRFDANPGGQRQGTITVGGRSISFTQCPNGFRGNAEKTACVPG